MQHPLKAFSPQRHREHREKMEIEKKESRIPIFPSKCVLIFLFIPPYISSVAPVSLW